MAATATAFAGDSTSPASNHAEDTASTPFQEPKFLPNWDNTDLCSSPGNGEHFLKSKSKRGRHRNGSPPAPISLREAIVEHQIGLSVNILLLLAFTHLFFPSLRSWTRPFVQLSYQNGPDSYLRGPDDLYFVGLWTVIFTGLRASVLSYILLPLASVCGLKRPKAQARFAEQGWLVIYYGSSAGVGMSVMYNSDYWMNLPELWANFPIVNISSVTKWYYLVQLAFWLQQIVVLNIEARRKDHWQMFAHHVVTCALIVCSYGYYQQGVGNMILVLMDSVDVVFSITKIFNYLRMQRTCDTMFGIFILSWVATRHGVYLMILRSIVRDVPSKMTYGCFSSVDGTRLSYDGGNELMKNILQPYLDPSGTVCFNYKMPLLFLSMLVFLQGITILWFFMILRVAWRVISGKGVHDVRSDDESEDVEADEEELSEKADPAAALADQPLEEDVGVEGLHLKRRGGASVGAAGARALRGRRGRAPAATSSALSGPGDRKELLGRIGCDKPS